MQSNEYRICCHSCRVKNGELCWCKVIYIGSEANHADLRLSPLHTAKLPHIDSDICALCRLSTTEYSDGYFALPPKLKIVISPLKVKQIILAIFVGEKELILAYLIFRKIIWFSVKIKSYSVFSLFPSFLLYKIRTYLSKVVQLMSLYSPLL